MRTPTYWLQVALLMHVAADRQNLVVCTTNLDTMQQEEPPVALWHRVARRIQLQPQQIRQLCAAYEASKCCTVFSSDLGERCNDIAQCWLDFAIDCY